MKKVIVGTLIATSLLFGARVDLDGGFKLGGGSISSTSADSNETISASTIDVGFDVMFPLGRRNNNLIMGIGGGLHIPTSSCGDTTDYEVGILSELHLLLGLKLDRNFIVYVNGNIGRQEIKDNVLNKTSNYSGSGAGVGMEIKVNRRTALDLQVTNYTMVNENNAEMDTSHFSISYSIKF